METKETIQGKVIKNVGVLDIRSTVEETLADIRSVKNVGVLICSPETARLIPKLNLGNVGATIEASVDAKITNGQEILGRDSFKHEGAPLELIANGQVIFTPDIPIEDVEKGLGKLWVNGQLLYPESLEGIIQSRLQHINGQARSYIQFPKLVVGNLSLHESYLESLDDASEIVVIGNLRATEMLSNDLLTQKIHRIQIIGNIVCRGENAKILLNRLDDRGGMAKVTTIPAGYEFVKEPIALDSGLLDALPGKKLYCNASVRIEPDVQPEELDRALETLVVRDLLIVPASLKKVVSQKCNMLETKAIFYEGELWLVEDELTLVTSRFDYLEGKATPVVRGELKVASEVEPKILADRLDKVHNFGEISCTPEQMVAIQTRLGFSEGRLRDSKKTRQKEKDENVIGNAGYLKL